MGAGDLSKKQLRLRVQRRARCSATLISAQDEEDADENERRTG
jgi:hypothetical protein